MRLDLTRIFLLLKLAKRYTTQGARFLIYIYIYIYDSRQRVFRRFFFLFYSLRSPRSVAANVLYCYIVLSSNSNRAITFTFDPITFGNLWTPLSSPALGKIIQLFFYKYSSSSCRAASTGIPDPLSPLLPVLHRLWQVFMATTRILT